jgi:signal transduction histidine kinase
VRSLLRRGSLQLEVVLNLAGVLTAGLATVAFVCVGLAVRTVEREAVDRLRISARQVQRVAARDAARLSDLAAFAQTVDVRLLAGTWRVVDRRGRDAWHGPGAKTPEAIAELIEEAWAEGEVVRGGLLPYADLRVVVPVHTVQGEEGALVGTIPVGMLWLRIRSLVGATAWVLGITAIVFVGFGAYTLRRRIVAPVREIAMASAALSEGRLSTRVDIPGESELGQLGRHFNQMAASLEEQQDALIDAERTLSRSERLASVGRLAAGVAHEVGNPIAAILGFVEVAQRDGGGGERTVEALASVKAEALRIRGIIRELLDLARSLEIDPRSYDVRELLEPIVGRMGAQPASRGVEVRLTVDPGIPAVRTDARRSEQILVNLIENAVHAVRGLDGGRVEVSVRKLGGGSESALGKPAPDVVPWVAVDVTDNGPGIEPEDLSHVFDPFYTTKDPGEGTGLGLWNAHRLAELLGGRLEAESQCGRTRFSLVLPVADSVDRDEPVATTDH